MALWKYCTRLGKGSGERLAQNDGIFNERRKDVVERWLFHANSPASPPRCDADYRVFANRRWHLSKTSEMTKTELAAKEGSRKVNGQASGEY